MHFSTLIGLAASIASAQAAASGFNYGNVKTDGTAKTQSDFEAEFKRAQNLPGTSGFSSARLYTMIQQGTTNTPISAIQAAIDTKTSLLLGLWGSAGEESFKNEITALKSAIDQYGTDFTDLIDGISVGSEDLYRVSETGVENESGLGASPDQLVSYIKQTRDAIEGTSASGAKIGHVDTFNAWQNGTNSEVAENCDWLGMDTYPYFQNKVDNGIENGKKLFWEAYDIVKQAGGGSKEVWITETGWPVSGKTENNGVPSTENAEKFWQDVACEILGTYHTWWYTLQDALPTTPNPSFGIIGSDLQSDPLYDLSCKKQNTTTTSSSASASGTGFSTSTKSATGAGSTSTGGYGSGSGFGGEGYNSTGSATGSNGSGSGTSSGSDASGSGSSSSGSAGADGASGTSASGTSGGSASSSSGAPLQSQTGNSATKASAAGVGILALLGLAAAL